MSSAVAQKLTEDDLQRIIARACEVGLRFAAQVPGTDQMLIICMDLPAANDNPHRTACAYSALSRDFLREHVEDTRTELTIEGVPIRLLVCSRASYSAALDRRLVAIAFGFGTVSTVDEGLKHRDGHVPVLCASQRYFHGIVPMVMEAGEQLNAIGGAA